ncbi:hypothetical protein ACOSP7_021995 [Xanthoceras sorbifolium]
MKMFTSLELPSRNRACTSHPSLSKCATGLACSKYMATRITCKRSRSIPSSSAPKGVIASPSVIASVNLANILRCPFHAFFQKTVVISATAEFTFLFLFCFDVCYEFGAEEAKATFERADIS